MYNTTYIFNSNILRYYNTTLQLLLKVIIMQDVRNYSIMKFFDIIFFYKESCKR